MHFKLATGIHHGEIDGDKAAVSEAQFDTFKPVPEDDPGTPLQLEVSGVGGFGFVHLAGFESAQCVKTLLHSVTSLVTITILVIIGK
ncbi:hypothetical protein PANT111_150123 [Pantoea brenneri]|uniref:Uncharacterized protein n=1 Tax=Pantoea brenneri TaxID=472694 RepID=A0AAX3J3V2_9GAMM|nr:hypothetical protein PANT111_150123 [Pantoea brenneri]